MVNVTITVNDQGARAFIVRLDQTVRNRRGLNAAVGQRITDELIDHFREKNATPNRLGGARTNFWSEIADATQLGEVTDDGATIAIADERIPLHIHGGTVRPKVAKVLTIPIHPQAHGRRASEYEENTGNELFRPKKSDGIPMNILATVIGDQLVPIYALATSATIRRDPTALPPDETLRAAIIQEVEDHLALELDN